MGWDDYWTRLATQVAGGNAPDLIQMDYRYLFEYAGRGAILPLDDYMGKELNIADFGEANLAACQIALEDPAGASDGAELARRLAASQEAQAVVDTLYARWAELEGRKARPLHLVGYEDEAGE